MQEMKKRNADIMNLHKLKSFSFIWIGWNGRKFTKNL